MIIAIGNAPSSGSTHLADLLDSLPFAVCPPEMHLFSPRCHFEDFESIRTRGFRRSATPCCYAAYGARFASGNLPYCGMTLDDVRGFLADEPTFRGFCERFFRRFAAYRGKEARLFFEKTPENVHSAGRFLEAFPDSVFLHIVRHPLHVFRSLRNRGAPFSIAAATWLVDVASSYALRGHDRFYTIHYEDLVRAPGEMVARFLAFIGEKMPEQSLETLYRENAYRSKLKRAASWGHGEYGLMADADERPLGREAEQALHYMAGLRVSRRYAWLFDLPEVSFQEVAGHYGYSLDTQTGQGPRVERIDLRSKRWLAKKWAKDVAAMSAKPSDLLAYLAPVERL